MRHPPATKKLRPLRFSEGGTLFANWADGSDGPVPAHVDTVREVLRANWNHGAMNELPELLASKGLIPLDWCETAIPWVYPSKPDARLGRDGQTPAALMSVFALVRLAERPDRKALAEELLRTHPPMPNWENIPFRGWFRVPSVVHTAQDTTWLGSNMCMRAMKLEGSFGLPSTGVLYPESAEVGFSAKSWRRFFQGWAAAHPNINALLDLGVVPWFTTRGIYLSVCKDASAFSDGIAVGAWGAHIS
jgi:hypothetical protein